MEYFEVMVRALAVLSLLGVILLAVLVVARLDPAIRSLADLASEAWQDTLNFFETSSKRQSGHGVPGELIERFESLERRVQAFQEDYQARVAALSARITRIRHEPTGAPTTQNEEEGVDLDALFPQRPAQQVANPGHRETRRERRLRRRR